MGGSWYYLFTDFKIKKSFRRGEMELFEYKYDGFGLKKKKETYISNSECKLKMQGCTETRSSDSWWQTSKKLIKWR